MEPREWQLREYITRAGRNPLGEWLQSITDKTTRARIRTRISRLRLGNFGDCRSVGEGVHELRLDFGPGYRVYYSRVGTSASSRLGIGVGYCRKFWDTFENTEVSHEQKIHCPTFR